MAALSEQLIHVHQELRQRLASLRRDAADGGPPGPRTDVFAPGQD